MSSNINPSTWASWDLRVQDKAFNLKMQNLLGQVSQFGLQVQSQLATLMSARGLAAILNGSGDLNAGSLAPVSTQTSVTTNQTVNCSGATMVALYYQFNSGIPATWTLTMNNVPVAVPVLIWLFNNSGGAVTIKFAATDKNGTALSSVGIGGGGTFNMVTAGLGAANGVTHAFAGGLFALAGQLNFLVF